MKKLYSVWVRKGEAVAHTLIKGESPLPFDPECEEKLYSFEAATWEEAMAIYALRQGWSPYKPAGEATPCPACGATYYPKGSGECWQCDYRN